MTCRFGAGRRHDRFMRESIAVNIACGLPPLFGLDQHLEQCANVADIECGQELRCGLQVDHDGKCEK